MPGTLLHDLIGKALAHEACADHADADGVSLELERVQRFI